jgi:hypothetical protein
LKQQTRHEQVGGLRVILDRCEFHEGLLGSQVGVVIEIFLRVIVVGRWDNAISLLEPLLTVAVDSPYASLEFGEFGWVSLINRPTSIAKVAK